MKSKYYQQLQPYLRAGFYALTVCLGLALAMVELERGNVLTFQRFSLAVLIVFVAELYTSWTYHKQKTQVSIKGLHRGQLQLQITHHLLLPVWIYLSGIGFLIYNYESGALLGQLAIQLGLLTLLFVNIRAYYREQTRLEKHTHYVYDLVKILIFFNMTNFFLNWQVQLDSPVRLAELWILGMVIGFLALFLMRQEQITAKSISLIGLIAFLIFISATILPTVLPITNILLSGYITLEYYIGAAVLYHLMHRDLSRKLVIEYVSVLVIVLTLLAALS